MLKAVQIDLARQKETIEEVCNFLMLASDYNYNAVILYLEDRIKTKTYYYNPDEESYSTDEMRQIVEYATKLGLEVIPAVSNFSHTDGFFKHEELRHLSELRDGDEGFFSAKGNPIYVTACPLLPESQCFFDSYISEVASIFPSKYFLVGLDEAFDIGSCELCKADVQEHGGFGHLFLNHIERTNKLINSFGKEMMMFDDMIWFCPEIISHIPKNVIMISWSYYYVERFPRVAFGNNKQIDRFREYEKYGLKYSMAVWSYFINNVDTYTKYANSYSPIAMINTTWQMSPELMHYMHPQIAYTGKLWNGELTADSQKRMMSSVAEVFGLDDNHSAVPLLAQAASKPFLVRVPAFRMHDVIVRRNDNFDDEYLTARYIHEQLKTIGVKNKYTDSLVYRAHRAKLLYEEFMLAQDIFDFRSGVISCNITNIVKQLECIKEELEKLYDGQYVSWKKFRRNIPTHSLDEEKEITIKDVNLLISSAKKAVIGENGVIDVTMMMPEKSVFAKLRVTVIYSDGREQELAPGAYHPLGTANYNIMDKGPYIYTVSFLIEGNKIVKGCRVSAAGYGNLCITHIIAFTNGKWYYPCNVKAMCGRVENEKHILVNDTRWCSLGNYDIMECMVHRELSKETASIEIEME